MKQIKITDKIKALCPQLELGCLSASIQLQAKNDALWQKMLALYEAKKDLPMDKIKDIPAIASSRMAYKALGKAPSRYRLSAEALHRRIVKGQDLYQINNVVDIINCLSIDTGFSIGGYDLDKIAGDILLDLGQANEPYEAIGRGNINIENLPVFRDASGAFGSPTSDSTRTCITNDTQKVLLVFLNFGGHAHLAQALDAAQQLLRDFAAGEELEVWRV
ncbi:B3/B4 domain-containing protein [Microscilla marina]|uniref:B3/4 domain protein n=1 Tax=Microscilla marina ATCC 23134 TaxID=313606 RepID=A1ZFS9_MICM2|nr:phenylalanine--tRNA ligase beta subunit-related protein [Microscilla marina]EAY30853.1 B3/4 domain protein [Microscilla marina ATCC 23134]